MNSCRFSILDLLKWQAFLCVSLACYVYLQREFVFVIVPLAIIAFLLVAERFSAILCLSLLVGSTVAGVIGFYVIMYDNQQLGIIDNAHVVRSAVFFGVLGALASGCCFALVRGSRSGLIAIRLSVIYVLAYVSFIDGW